MPHVWNNILVVTYEELVPQFYKSIDVVKNVVKRSEKRGYGLKKIHQGRGMGNRALIEYDSLPGRIKEALPDPRQGANPLEAFFREDGAAVNFFQEFRFEDKRSLKDCYQDGYVADASILNALIELKDARTRAIIASGHKAKNLWQTLSEDAQAFLPVCREKYGLSYDLPSSYKRLRAKAEKYQAEGYRSLISARHYTDNARRVTDDIFALFESIFAGQKGYKPGYREVYETYASFLSGDKILINTTTGERYNPEDFQYLSERTIHEYLTRWQSKISTMEIRSGDRQQFMGKFKPWHGLEKPKYAGSLLSIDDRQPPFTYADSQRAWFYLGYDVGAECFTAWVHGKKKEGIILDFYRALVRNYHGWGINLPAELEAESSLNSSFKSTFLREGNMFENVRIEANNARGKYIERVFGEIRYKRDKEQPGWIARKEARSESRQAGPEKAVHIPYDSIITNSLQIIEDWNNEPHSTYTDKTRWEVFTQMQHPDIKPTNWRGIIPYLGYKESTSCRVGRISLQRTDWLIGDKGNVCVGDDLIAMMKLLEGEKLDVYWLDGHGGDVIRAYAYIGDQYMCELMPVPRYQKAKIEQTEKDLQNREIMSAYVRTVEAYGRRHKKEIDRVLVMNSEHSRPAPRTEFIMPELHRKKDHEIFRKLQEEKQKIARLEDWSQEEPGEPKGQESTGASLPEAYEEKKPKGYVVPSLGERF